MEYDKFVDSFKISLFWLDELLNHYSLGNNVESLPFEQSLGLFFCEEKMLQVAKNKD